MSKGTTDTYMAALVEEVERRKRLPGLHDYSYGRLIADTTQEQRKEIADRYKHRRRKGTTGSEKFLEPNDTEDLRRAGLITGEG